MQYFKSNRMPAIVVVIAAVIALLTCVAHAESVVATIPVTQPTGVDIDQLQGLLYVGSWTGSIAVVNEKTNTVVNTINVGREVGDLAVNPVTSRLYACNSIRGVVTVIDTRRNKVITTIPIRGGDGSPSSVAVNFRTNKIYVTDWERAVVVIDGATNNIITEIYGPVLPTRLALNPITRRLYIADENYYGGVGVADTDTDQFITEIFTPGMYTSGVAIDFVHHRVYATEETSVFNEAILTEIDATTNTVLRTLPVHNYLSNVAVNPFTREIYAGNTEMNTFNFNKLLVIDAKAFSVVESFPTDTYPAWLCLDPVRKMLYVSPAQGSAITAISTRKNR
ncbi:MAG TPA: YncE family protein [Candidatus Angelobacter sp.]|nr:YncE family protein [Candidatus Angelobacter sp.]